MATEGHPSKRSQALLIDKHDSKIDREMKMKVGKKKETMDIKSICINKKHNIDSIILKLTINMKSNSTVPFNSRKYNMVDNKTNVN